MLDVGRSLESFSIRLVRSATSSRADTWHLKPETISKISWWQNRLSVVQAWRPGFHSQNKKNPESIWFRVLSKNFGGVLLSHTASRAVPSALKSLTSVFGMGTGVASSQLPPKNGAPFLFDLYQDISQFFKKFAIRSDHVNYFAAKPHDQLVPVSWMCCHTYTPGLSTLSSTRGLQFCMFPCRRDILSWGRFPA